LRITIGRVTAPSGRSVWALIVDGRCRPLFKLRRAYWRELSSTDTTT
jgi:hypothetical protein